MSQQTVESVIGRLASDEGFRERFAENRGAELRALLAIGSGACEKFAERLDPRIQKISLRRAHGQSPSPPPLEPDPFSKDQGGGIGLRDVVVYVDGRATNVGTVEFAAGLAHEHEAHLTGVFIQPEPAVSPSEMFARGKGIQDVIAAHQAQLSEIEADLHARFESIVGRHGIQAEWRRVAWIDSSESAVHARYGDLAVVARQDPMDQQVGPPGLVESLVLTSGRPTIVLPPRWTATQMRRILVGWNAGREATRAVADALPLLVRADAVEVLVVYREGHLAGHGQEPGADVARHLARHRAHVEVRRLSSGGEDVGRLLLSRAAAFSADLIVMGAYGHSHLREWIFGGVTRTALREAELPVLMSR
jgi:nucleotide-binding universal stress UspA family protein